MIELKNPDQIGSMKQAGVIVAKLLDRLRAAAVPGATTQALDEIAQRTIKEMGGQAAFKGYRGFPASICTSINEEVVHGIPGKRVLQEGDIIGMDVGASVNGYYADAAITVGVGNISKEKQRLIDVTTEALNRAIKAARVGNRLSDISHAVQSYVESQGYSVVREFVGHGIGARLHEEPQVPNYGEPGMGPELKAGMAIAIEPMVNEGGPQVKVLDDGWTAVTADHKPSAHMEHTIAITENGTEVITRCQKKKP